jgi:hypothetical protein
MTVAIIGAGMAGLLAGAMLRGRAQVFEASPALPNNHHALLRFRTDTIAQHLNIPFKEVKVMKIVKPHRNRVAETICYSLKTSGKAAVRSSVTALGEIDKRFIAPPDFIAQLEAQQVVKPFYGQAFTLHDLMEREARGMPTISTMPMPSLMSLLNYDHEVEFIYQDAWVITGDVDVPSDMCATIYYPSPDSPVTRATLTGTSVQIELMPQYDQTFDGRLLGSKVSDLVEEVLHDFGLEGRGGEFEMKQQRYAKIQPIPEGERRRFIMWATDEFKVYSVGRFAVWKPGLLLDDVFHDIRKVQVMMRNECNYEGRLRA